MLDYVCRYFEHFWEERKSSDGNCRAPRIALSLLAIFEEYTELPIAGGDDENGNTASPHWRRWLGVRNRYVASFTAFFAGIWTDWTSVRKVKDGETTDSLFGFLTCDANETVGAVHPKAMPVILTEQSDVEGWLCAETGDALKLQWPLQEGLLPIVEQPLSGSVV